MQISFKWLTNFKLLSIVTPSNFTLSVAFIISPFISKFSPHNLPDECLYWHFYWRFHFIFFFFTLVTCSHHLQSFISWSFLYCIIGWEMACYVQCCQNQFCNFSSPPGYQFSQLNYEWCSTCWIKLTQSSSWHNAYFQS